jgi:hypothetical protein
MNGKFLGRSLAGVILLVLMMAAAPAWGADDLQVSLTPEQSELTVGDPLQLTLEVTHPAGTQVIIPRLDPVWGSFEVRSQSPATTATNDDGTETTRQIVEVSLFDIGEVETPPWSLTLTDGAGGVFEEPVPPVTLTVVPTLDAEDNELRDIKPQAGLAVPATWPWIVGGLLLAVALAVAGLWAYRRWRGQPFLAPALDTRSPLQVAYDELARIEGLGLLEQAQFKEYYTLVTDCLRTYLEQQFGLRVFDRTTSELRVLLRGSDLAPEHSRRFLDLFAESDLVKFAKFRPDRETARALLGEARELVTLTSEEAMARASQQAADLRSGDEGSELEEFFQGASLTQDEAPVAASRLGYQPGR